MLEFLGYATCWTRPKETIIKIYLLNIKGHKSYWCEDCKNSCDNFEFLPKDKKKNLKKIIEEVIE